MKLYQKRLTDMRRNLKDISKALRKTGSGERKDLDEAIAVQWRDIFELRARYIVNRANAQERAIRNGWEQSDIDALINVLQEWMDETLWMKEISESLRKNKMAASA